MLFFSKSAAIIDTQMRLGQALFCKKVQGAATTSAGLEMHKCRGGSSTGAGFRRFPSLSVRSTRPVARSGVDNRGRPWTAWTTLRVDHPGHRAHPCPEPPPAGRQRPQGARVPNGTRGGAAQGVQGACRPLRRRPIGPGRRPWGTWTPPSGGLLIPWPTTRARGGYMPRLGPSSPRVRSRSRSLDLACWRSMWALAALEAASAASIARCLSAALCSSA